MADFTEAIQRQKSTRSPIKENLSFSDFCDLKDLIEDGGIGAGITNVKLTSELYITELHMRKPSVPDKILAKIRVETADEDGYDSLLARINDEIAEEAFGDAECVDSIEGRNWTLKYSAKDGDDVITLTIQTKGRDITATLDNYLNDSTLAKVEAWADTVAILSDGVED